ncbi:MAG: aminotransferase class I/II-fold pyridoxal phosphate-dependent enzyme [Legionellaceae bacterium]|nr:aminotransferase class I/II-fold pyridoxal phosphate-dependent enzyme [Legionellaceae bacterium]
MKTMDDYQSFLCSEYQIPNISLPYSTPKVPASDLINLKTAEFIHPVIESVLQKISFKDTSHYQSYPFLGDSLERISNILNVERSKMTFSAGSDIMISVLMESLGKITGRVILQAPTYPGWTNYASLRNIEITSLSFGQTVAGGFCSKDFITQMKSAKPSMLVIANPHSPTGFFFNQNEMLDIAACAKEHGHLLVIDECFSSFAPICHSSLLKSFDNVLYIRSFSKSHGIAGVRIALMVASQRITNYIANWNLESTISGDALRILEHVLLNEDRISMARQDIVDVREEFILQLKVLKPNWHALPSSANFLVLNLGGFDNPAQIVKFFYDNGYYIRDLSNIPGFERCIRITIAHWGIMKNVLKVIDALNN